MSTADIKTTAGRAPVDAAGFVADAERITNDYDVDAVRDVYAADAVWTSTIDGLVIRARGIEEIRERWRQMCEFGRMRQLTVRKQLVVADESTIVNQWEGSLRGRSDAHGIEVWRFDADGRVSEQRLYGYLNAGPDSSIVQSLRMLAAYPLTAATFARARLGRGSQQ
jgi:ketosteroid isomerase-like protein